MDPETGSGARVLLVDDDHLLRTMLQRVLLKHGYRVRQAADGEFVEQLIDAETPDIVVTDIVMPETDGLEVLKLIRRKCPHVPVVVMSGSKIDNGLDFLGFASRLGAVSVLAKPFTPKQFIDAIAEALENSPGKA